MYLKERKKFKVVYYFGVLTNIYLVLCLKHSAILEKKLRIAKLFFLQMQYKYYLQQNFIKTKTGFEQ